MKINGYWLGTGLILLVGFGVDLYRTEGFSIGLTPLEAIFQILNNIFCIICFGLAFKQKGEKNG